MAKQPVKVELFYNGVWNDRTSAALVRDEITITRGRANESSQPAPTTCTLTFRGWEFNPGNPTSALHGLIGRNTPIRVTVGTSVRFAGQVASWTPRQSLGGPNIPPDRWVQVEAAGVTRRLGQGQDPLRSAPHRFILTQTPGALGFWPLDDPDGSLRSRAVIGRPLVHGKAPPPISESNRPGYGQGQVAPWLPAGIKCTSEAGTITAPLAGGTTGGWVVDLMYRADQSTTGSPPIAVAIIVIGGGLDFRASWGTDDGFGFLVSNEGGGIIDSELAADNSPLLDGQPHHVRWKVLENTGTSTQFELFVDGVLEFQTILDIGTTTTPAPAAVKLSWNGEVDATTPIQLSTLAFWNFADAPNGDTVAAYFGYAGEHAGDRFIRLTSEESITSTVVPFTPEDTVPCGPQYPDGLLAILREGAIVDDGLLTDQRAGFGAVDYRTGRSRYNQPAALTLDYDQAQVAPPLDPVVLDDQQFRNDVTAKRRDGGEVRAVDQASVDTVGRTTTSVTVNTLSDGHDLESQAGWRLHLGTTEGTRFPKVTVDLDASPELTAAVDAADAGDRATIANLPAELTPDLASLLVLGYTETIGSHRRRITFNCAPEGPYHIAEVEHPTLATLGSTSATISGGEGATETTITINCGAGPDWVHEGVDYDIVVAGERMTVVGTGGTASTFPTQLRELIVVRSVNGVVKSHPPGAPVAMFDPAYIGL